MTKLKRRERYIAIFAALGRTPEAIADELHLPLARVQRALNNPLCSAAAQGYQREFTRTGAIRGVSRIMQDVDDNVGFLIDVRQGKHDDGTMEGLRARIQAAAMLFDRQVPRRQERETHETRRIIIERDQREVIEAVCEEVGQPLRLTHRSIDEAIDEADERERAEDD